MLNLSREDLQAIEEIVDRVIDKKLEEKLDKKLKPIHRSIRKLQKDLLTISDYFDQQTISLSKRLTRVENYLHLPPVTE